MLPVLRLAAEGEASISSATEILSDQFSLTPIERDTLLPSGKLKVIRSRIHWAKAYLKQAGLVEPTKRGHFRITDRGRTVLQNPPTRIDIAFLDQFQEFREFKARGKQTEGHDAAPQSQTDPSASPEDVLTGAYQQITDAFIAELIDRLLGGTPAFFEKAIVELLLAMGYGGSTEEAGRAIGKAGDDGVDGVIDQDPLGVDQIYIQAKRYNAGNTVGPAAIREFYGALSMKKAQKGIFVTTSGFTKSALDTASQIGGRIVLIDGQQLGRLMVRYNVGCRDKYTLHVKDFDEDFFD
ncbi:MAG: restriction endonuclease [Alphaproteobacteria bacterium HGW-Alphaproteobacteria-14]|nr:MAG: restriction endonuclease [Alphaproteobacteria bacterium HGW-Alphaproteobacteria-14]